MKPLCIDLYCGLGGWTDGFLAEGYDAVGFDIERHVYGEHRYAGELVIQDVRTLDGAQFRDATIIVASPPCQEFSYRAMPWSRAKALGPPTLGMELFAQAFRIQREACAAADRFIPLVVENVRGAQRYVGAARWNFGSYFLWGDVPALMPIRTRSEHVKVPGENWNRFNQTGATSYFNMRAEQALGQKNSGGSWFAKGPRGEAGAANNPDGRREGRKAMSIGIIPRVPGNQDDVRTHWSGSIGRKAAAARIAMVPLPLARHIAQTYRPGVERGI